ncbi:MAG: hypothetical protein Q3979_09515 [Actinomycetaceae bacterium]|nr:hypothetical protein [Actinomycetaceae bacterium]
MIRAGSGSKWLFPGVAIVAAIALVATLLAAGTRLDNQDLTPTKASVSEQARQNLATKAARLRQTASSLSAQHPEVGLYASIEKRARAYEDALGGVWEPWPTGAPSGQTNPAVNTAPPDDPDIVAMLDDLSSSSLRAASSAEESDRPTYVSIALSSRLAAVDASKTLGGTATCGQADPQAAGKAAADSKSLDVAEYARQWMETDAASLDATARQAASQRIESITALQSSMLESGAKDKRPAVAAPPELDGDQTPTSKGLSMLTNRLVAVSASADDEAREAIVSYGCSLYQTSDEVERAGALPGIE